MALEQDMRTCSITGLKVHKPAENLIKANAVFAVVCMLLGGVLALAVALTRWPVTQRIIDSDLFYRALTGHALDMLIAWIIFFEMAGLYFGSAVLLNGRVAAPKIGWLAFILMAVGGLTINYEVVMGHATVMFTSYVPLQASPLYYLSVILFAVGALIVCCLFFATIVKARLDGTYTNPSLPLVTFGLACAAIIAVVTLAHGAIIYIPTLLWSLGIIQHIDPMTYRVIWWALGHPSQQINVCAMISCWYLLGTLTVGAKAENQKLARTAFVFYVLFINVASEHHLLVDPVISPAHKVWNTGYVMHLAVLSSMIHALKVPAGIEKALRRQGYNNGLFEWLKKAPWGNPSFSGLMLSLLIFGFMGGITGVIFGTEQVNLTAHNTWRITGHFHATVASGTTLAFMATTYYIVPIIFQREMVMKGLLKFQPWLFGIGMILMAGGQMLAGIYGIPRRHYDIFTFGGNPLTVAWDPTAMLFMTIFGVGAIIAILGGVIFVLTVVLSIIAGKKVA
ncbi:MAG: cbb3-type cytochrome c oxidase subunit I [Nitrospirota bacterium]|nr:cbb3-type cytochrome c oxidase subunit I [Nitrospirota bacterium]